MVANAFLLRQQLLDHLLDGTKRDIDKECGYPAQISVQQYRLAYEREGLATRCVTCLPDESWAVTPEIYEVEDLEDTEFEKAWKDLDEKLHLYHWMHRVDQLSGIGQFGILFLGLDDGKALNEPVEGIDEQGEPSGTASHQLIYLRAFDQSVVAVAKKETDTTNPRFGQPVLYNINYQDPTDAGESFNATVHWTRVLHVADGRDMSEVYGTPRLRKVYNRIYDIRKILSGSGEMFWKGAFPGISFEMDPSLVKDGIEMDTDGMKKQFSAYSNGLQRYLALAGVAAKSLTPQVADPAAHVESQLKAIAISMSIPLRILFGSEEAKLASSQDSRTWNKRVMKRQKDYLNTMLVRPFVSRLIAFGVLPEPEQNIKICWPDLNTPTDDDKATVAQKRTSAMKDYVAGNVDQLIPPKSYLTIVQGMTMEEVQAVEDEAVSYQEELVKKQEDEAKALAAQGIVPPPVGPNDTKVEPGKVPAVRSAKVPPVNTPPRGGARE